ncbi:magnesium chelatase domain-containing protein, partial [Enterococcus faecium]
HGAIVLGELALDGAVRPISGILPMLIDAYHKGYSIFFVPKDNAAEAGYIRGARVFPVESLSAIAAHLRGEAAIAPAEAKPFA